MIRNSRSKVMLYTALSLCVTVFSIKMGILAQGRVPKDPHSEAQVMLDAQEIVKGNHKFGIVSYAHFPNGPVYILLPAIRFGIDKKDELRIVPICFSGICLGILCWGLLSASRSWVCVPLALGLVASLLYQPGIVDWMGALHEHSYALALCFGTMGLALMRAVGRKTLFLLSFVCGWIGYDFTFCFLFSLTACRWLLHGRTANSISSVLRKTLIDCTIAGLGIFAAVVTHVLQNTLALGGLSIALADLMGSAAARAGLDMAEGLNPEYFQKLRWAGDAKPYPRSDLIHDLVMTFILPPPWPNSPLWTNTSLAVIEYTILAGFLVVGLIWRSVSLFKADKPLRLLGYSFFLYFASVLFVPLAAFTWLVLMPNHGRFHFHFIPRHFFVPAVLLAVIMYEALCRCLDSRQTPENGVVK